MTIRRSISSSRFRFTGNDEYHTDYRLRDRKGRDFTDLFEIHIIELQKELDDTEVADWVRFFNAETKEELDMIKTQNPGLLEAIREVKMMSLSKRMRLRYEAHLKEVRDRKAREDYVREEGLQDGIRQGIDQGAEQKLLSQIERKLAAGQTEEQIAEDLLEPLDHIRELRKKIK
ncbi:MAG: Rpn family recombination-promoting nuclease/putative transposase [Clostridiales bacterium]|nr:Rpn family recombination-promoting nuclease/putative transposase [Clostridiales bacterium]